MSRTTALGFTFDLEDHRPDPSWPMRYPEVTRHVLMFLAERDLKATVFVLGRVAHEAPELIREIADAGHEIGFHSFAHRHLVDETEDELRAQLSDNKHHLEDLIGREVHGYRAPAFSLTHESRWAVEVIKDVGFTYSSSVLPAKNPIFGFAGAPTTAFRWPNGLLEIPACVGSIGPLRLPYLGGIYLRYLPKMLIHRCLRHSDMQAINWVYCHPHDFDYGERFYRISGTSTLTSLLLWFNRRRTFSKLAALYDDEFVVAESRCFTALIDAGVFDDAPTFSPG